MKKILLLLLILALGVTAFGVRRCAESDGTDAFCFSDDEELHFGTGLDVDIGWFTDDADAHYLGIKVQTFIGFETATFEHRYSYTGLSYNLNVQTPSVAGLEVQNGEALTCVGLDGGAAEIGTTEGYVSIGDDADFLRFVMPIPCLWVDTAQTESLIVSFDIHEQAGEECNIDVRIFECGTNLSAIITDTLVITDGDARQWEPLVTYAAGIGAAAQTTLTADDSYLIIEITPTADTDDFYVYGARLLYQTGIQATQ